MPKISKFTYSIFYPFELNEVLNSTFSSQENISNFTSLLSDKNRFEHLVSIVASNIEILEELIGFEINLKLDIYVIRAELFKSTPEPLLIEYDSVPELMILHLCKEIIKKVLSINQIRCIDEIEQLKSICATLCSFSKEMDLKTKTSLFKHCNTIFMYEKKILEKKGFKCSIEYDDLEIISKQHTLSKYIEKSYEQLY